MEVHFFADHHVWFLGFDEHYRSVYHWDPTYPFTLTNRGLPLTASYAASIVLISRSLQERRDRVEPRQSGLINENAEEEEARVILDYLTAQNRALAVIYKTLQELQIKVDNANVVS